MDDRYHGIVVAAPAEWDDEPQRVGLQLLTNRSECTEVRPRIIQGLRRNRFVPSRVPLLKDALTTEILLCGECVVRGAA
jgi:hypothetical protein